MMQIGYLFMDCRNMPNRTFLMGNTHSLTNSWGSIYKEMVVRYWEKKKKVLKLRNEQIMFCFTVCSFEKKSPVMVSLKLEYTASYFAYGLCATPFPAFMLVGPIGSYWQGMKSCYSNFRHRCGFLICFFNVLILPPDWYSTHLAPLTTKPQTSYVKSNTDMKLLRMCEFKMQSFLFLKIGCLYKYPWTSLLSATVLLYLLAILKFGVYSWY